MTISATRNLTFICLFAAAVALPKAVLGQTYTAQIDGQTYQFSVEARGEVSLELLQQQFWWGKLDLTRSVALAVGSELGSDGGYCGASYATNFLVCGSGVVRSVRFAWSYDPSSIFLTEAVIDGELQSFIDYAADLNEFNYAIARAVPEISTNGAAAGIAAVFAIMLLFYEVLMRKIKSARRAFKKT